MQQTHVRETHTQTHNLHYNTHERVCMRVCVCVSAHSNIVLIAIVRLKLFTTATDFQRPESATISSLFL